MIIEQNEIKNRINNEILNKDVFYDEIMMKFAFNSNELMSKSQIIYNGESYKIHINELTETSFKDNIQKKLPYLDISECKAKLIEREIIHADEKLFTIEINKNINNESLNSEFTFKLMKENGDLLVDNICESYKVKFPINKNEIEIEKYLDIKENYGYDLSNPSDKFFNDICTPFKNLNDTDLVLEDRRKFFNKTISCINSGKIGNFTGIDENGYSICNFEEIPQESSLKIETSIFDDLINGNYLIFTCINLLIYKPITNYSIYIFISIISITTISLILHKFISNDIDNKVEFQKNDILSIFPMEVGKSYNDYRRANICKNSIEIENLKIYDNNEYLVTEKSNDKNSNIVDIGVEDLKKVYKNENILSLVENNKVGFPNILNDNTNLNNFDILDNLDKINYDRKNSTFSERNIDRKTNNFIYSKKTNLNTAVTLKMLKSDFEIEEVVSFDVIPTSNIIKSKCKSCLFNDCTPKTLPDYQKINEIGDINKDNRPIYQYFWDDFKMSQQFLNLIFMTSLINSFRNRFLLLCLSLSIEIFFNAFFFDSQTISKQTYHKMNVGKISLGWKILNDLTNSIWPALITSFLMGIFSLIIEPPENFVNEYKEGLLSQDENVQNEAM